MLWLLWNDIYHLISGLEVSTGARAGPLPLPWLEEVDEAKKSHPMVIHFTDKHEGCRQEMIMRTVKETRTVLERQAWESMAIKRLARSPDHCLNLKN